MLAIVVILVGVVAGCGSTTDSSGGDGADALSSVDLTPLADAAPIRLGGATDTPTVLNVWATWCAPCRKEMPAFEEVSGTYEGVVRFVGVNLGDTESSARQFIVDTGVTFDQYLDLQSDVQAALSITTMPATAFIRADGSVAAVHNGALDTAELEAMLADELGVASPTGGAG